MRDVNTALRQLEKRVEASLRKKENSGDTVDLPEDLLGDALRLELGLTLLADILPGEIKAGNLWAVLNGHELPGILFSFDQKLQIERARHYLSSFRSPAYAQRAQNRYEQLPERLRLFEATPNGTAGIFRRKPLSICADRTVIYNELLANPVPYRVRPARFAGEGVYRFRYKGRFDSVRFPPHLILPPPSQHPLLTDVNRSARGTLSISWNELQETALWMDLREAEPSRNISAEERGNWVKRFARVQLDRWDESTSRYIRTDTLTLNGLFHLAGMVSSGKSTLMDVVSVWAVRKELKVAIVVGDVVSVLNRARLFVRLGIDAAPILGGFNRMRHIARLQGAQSADDEPVLTEAPHEGFRWISTGCPLDALRDERKRTSLSVDETPCSRLEPFAGSEGDAEDEEVPPTQAREGRYCPLYSVCPRHQAQRDLVSAPLWIATPASLVYTRVDGAVGQERTHFAEMVYRRADLLLVDEADQVQVQLDDIFNPNQTLVDETGSAWLNRLNSTMATRLSLGGRAKLAQESVSAWTQAHDTAQNAVNRLYKWVQQSKNIQRFVNEENAYFTDWILLHQVVEALSGGTRERFNTGSHSDPAAYNRLSDLINALIDDPLGEENGETPLSTLAVASLSHRHGAAVGERIGEWIKTNRSPELVFSEDDVRKWRERLEFGLIVAVLQNSVAYLADNWTDVEAPFRLEEASSSLFHRPPEAYFPLLPEPPMGQVLAFQHVPSSTQGGAGELRFFRCTAIGRALLLRFPDLLAQDNIAGPHTLLLSGTSWAGDSPSYHLQVPVDGILKAPPSEVAAIENSRFYLRTFSEEDGKPISVSGKQGEARHAALRRMVTKLVAQPDGPGGEESPLEKYLSQIAEPERRRALFLVGSYTEAKEVYAHLTETPGLLKPGEVCYLEPDDNTFNASYKGASLRRGVVHRFAQTGARVLIAPLLAVERGHNILTDDGKQAALGAAFFLVRPHPPKDDLGFAMHSINRWGMDKYGNPAFLRSLLRETSEPADLDAAARAFRTRAFQKWRHLLKLPLIYSTLPEAERTAMTWSQLVTMWQVIGRLVRGGCAAHVYFCDAAFRLQTPSSSNSGELDSEQTYDKPSQLAAPSLLVEMKRVLQEALDIDDDGSERQASMPTEKHRNQDLIRTLYGPLFKALREMGGL